MGKRLLLGLLMLGAVSPLGADEPDDIWTFKSAKANETLRKYQAARKKIDEAHEKSRGENRAELIAKLQEEVKAATKANKLDDALAIRDAINVLRDSPHPAAPVQHAKAGVYLDDLAEGPFQVRGALGKHGHNQLGAAITVQGAPFKHSLCTHPDPNSVSFVNYNIQGKYQKFEGAVAIADFDRAAADREDGTTKRTQLTFKVFGDKKLLWSSNPLVNGGSSQVFSINVRHVKTLHLRVECPGLHGYRFAMWLDPILTE